MTVYNNVLVFNTLVFIYSRRMRHIKDFLKDVELLI